MYNLFHYLAYPLCVAELIDMYSALRVDRATVDRFYVFHEISGPSSEVINPYPVIPFQSCEFAQSASQKPVRLRVLFVGLNINCWFIVP